MRVRSHLELKRYFDIDLLLNEKNAREIWDRTEKMLQQDALRPWGIFERFDVKAICTTDRSGRKTSIPSRAC